MKLDTYALKLIDKSFDILFDALPDKPRRVPLSNGQYGYRFKKKDIAQVIIQKLAFVRSSLNASILLLDDGFVIEEGILTRTIDEANEDIRFLSSAITGEKTEEHESYLKNFWDWGKSIENPSTSTSEQKSKKSPGFTRRKQIRAEIQKGAHDYQKAKEPTYEELSRKTYGFYSKFVHSRSSGIMLIYRGNPPRFCPRGISHIPDDESKYHTINLSIYGSLIAYHCAGKALKASYLIKELSYYLYLVIKENKIDELVRNPPKWMMTLD